MKKLLIAGLLLTTSCFVATQAFSGAFNNDGSPGGDVTITDAGAGGDLVFAPSPKVMISGATGDNAYAMAGGHASTVNKDEAKAYAMMSSDSQMYWADFTADTVVTNVDGSNTLAGTWQTF